MNSARSTLFLAVAFLLLGSTAQQSCATGTGVPRGNSSLFNDLGGIEGLRPLVDDLAWRFATDSLLAPTLATVEIGPLKEEILAFLCARTGGPCLDAGDRPIISFEGSPSAAAQVVIKHLREAALATGVRPEVTEELRKKVESEVRAVIGPPR